MERELLRVTTNMLNNENDDTQLLLTIFLSLPSYFTHYESSTMNNLNLMKMKSKLK